MKPSHKLIASITGIVTVLLTSIAVYLAFNQRELDGNISVSSNEEVGTIYVNSSSINTGIKINENKMNKNKSGKIIVTNNPDNEKEIYKKEIIDQDSRGGILILGSGFEVEGNKAGHIWMIDKKTLTNKNNHDYDKVDKKPLTDERDYKRTDGLKKRECILNDNIHKAAARGYINFVNKCLQLGISPNIQEELGWTPLHSASRHGHFNIVELLVDYGAKINVPDITERTARDQAQISEHKEIDKYLENHGGWTRWGVRWWPQSNSN